MALGCSNPATKDVELSLAWGGSVVLKLCMECSPFFEEKKEEAQSLHAHAPAQRSTPEALTPRGERE